MAIEYGRRRRGQPEAKHQAALGSDVPLSIGRPVIRHLDALSIMIGRCYD